MKFLSNDGLKVVLSKIKEMFYTKTEVDEKLKSVSGGGTSIDEKITIKSNSNDGLFFNFYKKGNVVKVFEILNRETIYSSYVPDNFLPKGFEKYGAFIIGELVEVEYRENRSSPNLVIKNNKNIEITEYSHSVENMKYKGYYGEIFVGEYFTN